MKILYVTTILGTMDFFISQIKYLKNKGHEVELACNITRAVDEKILDLDCKIHDIKFQRSPLSKENFLAYKQIQDVIKGGNFDIVHVHTPIASFITRLAARNVNVKIIYTAHGFHFHKDAPIKNWLLYYPLEKFTSRYTDVLLTMNSEDYSNSKNFKIRAGGFKRKINGVGINVSNFTAVSNKEKKEYREKYGYSDSKFILFYAAELNNNKNQEVLIESISHLKGNYPNLLLLLAGSGPNESYYEHLIKQKSLENNVKLLGYRRDIKDLLKVVDIVVASSKREGLPVNIMEAMACGLPLIVSDIRGHRDLVENGVNGYVIVNKMEYFVEKIETLINDRSIVNTFGENSLKIIEEYEEDKLNVQIENVYNEI